MGIETLPTPQGEVPEPLPKGTLAPSDTTPGIMPPGMDYEIDQGQPGMPFQQDMPGPMEPGADEGLPGLPLDDLLPPTDLPGAAPGDSLMPNFDAVPNPDDGGAVEPRRENRSAGPQGVSAHQAPSGPNVGYAAVQASATDSGTAKRRPVARAAARKSAAAAPLGLDGYCPVELADREAWLQGDPRWSAVHEGRAYRFAGAAQRQHFLANPDRYAPVSAGCDPVLLVDAKRKVLGRTEFCVVCKDRLYMFSSKETFAKFRKDANRYCGAVAR